jgi:hypothetical protein
VVELPGLTATFRDDPAVLARAAGSDVAEGYVVSPRVPLATLLEEVTMNDLVSALLLCGGVLVGVFALPFLLAWLEGPREHEPPVHRHRFTPESGRVTATPPREPDLPRSTGEV